MKDKFHVELRENQIVCQSNMKTPTISVLRGGFTNGGSVRLASLTQAGHRTTSKPQHLIIMSNPQAISYAEGIIEGIREDIEEYNAIDFEVHSEKHILYNRRCVENAEHKIQNIQVLVDTLRAGLGGASISFSQRE